jgi:hypothetical protein
MDELEQAASEWRSRASYTVPQPQVEIDPWAMVVGVSVGIALGTLAHWLIIAYWLSDLIERIFKCVPN